MWLRIKRNGKRRSKAASLTNSTTIGWSVEEKTGYERRCWLSEQTLGANGLSISELLRGRIVSPLINFDSLVPTYGFDDGYYNAPIPIRNTDCINMYTSQAIKWILTLLGSPTKLLDTKDQKAIYRETFPKVQR